jgi:hypothetical protein
MRMFENQKSYSCLYALTVTLLMTRKFTIRFKTMSSEKVKTFLKKATFLINRLNASLFKKSLTKNLLRKGFIENGMPFGFDNLIPNPYSA